MNFARLSFLLGLSVVGIACASPAEESTQAGTQDMTAEWLASNIPPGSGIEGKVLALLNDSTMSSTRYQNECGFSTTQASALISYRSGDDALSISDDQRFDTVKEADAVPFTDADFWANTVRCAMLHTPGPGVCVPGTHVPVILELLVDESGSMSGDKWAATRDSLLALFEQFHADSDPNVLVGVQMFDDNPTTKVKPKAVDQDHFNDLSDLVDKPTPHGGATGLLKALDAGIRAVDSVSTTAGAQRIVVLLTDGMPNGGAQEQQQALDLVTEAHAKGVQLYSVGIGPFPGGAGYSPAFMGQLAVAGGTAPTNCDPASTDTSSAGNDSSIACDARPADSSSWPRSAR